MSTADCKSMLVLANPQTVAKEWKRVSKFKNLHDEDIRLFNHPKVGQVWVNEDEGELSTDASDIRNVQASALKASDFYVAFESCTKDGVELCCSVMAVHKPFFDKNDCFDSIHLAGVIERLYPKGLTFEEDAEASFCIDQEITLDEVKRLFREAGFQLDERAQRMLDV